MNSVIVKRVLDEAHHMIKTNDTIREIASIFKVSKSTVHKDLHDRLKFINIRLHDQISYILKYHIDIRHIRGGESTKKKYKNVNLNN